MIVKRKKVCKMAMLFTSDLHLGHNNVLLSRQQQPDMVEQLLHTQEL